MSNQHHVTYSKEKEKWQIKPSNGQRSIKDFNRKQDAVDRAREISTNKKTELVVHKKDGKIGFKDSHGNDPRNIKG